ncbi:MAG: phosphatase PAP2 family protein [Minisyncoccia bacterium]
MAAFDTQLFFLLNSLVGKSTFVDGIIIFCASYLAYILVALLLALVFFSSYSRYKKLEILVAVATSSIIARLGVTEIIRAFYHRPRPFSVFPTHQLITDSAWSFPSGHATFFFAMATALYLYNKKWGIGFFLATILITVSRVIAGVHYPSDILGGALIGILVGYLTVFFIRKITTRYA